MMEDVGECSHTQTLCLQPEKIISHSSYFTVLRLCHFCAVIESLILTIFCNKARHGNLAILLGKQTCFVENISHWDLIFCPLLHCKQDLSSDHSDKQFYKTPVHPPCPTSPKYLIHPLIQPVWCYASAQFIEQIPELLALWYNSEWSVEYYHCENHFIKRVKIKWNFFLIIYLPNKALWPWNSL